MEREDWIAGGGDTAQRKVGLLDVLLPGRRRALERRLEAEHSARVYFERLHKRRTREMRQWRGELVHAHRVIRGMTRDLDDAQQAEETLTEELFDARDEAAALRERLREKGKTNAELAQRLREVLQQRNRLWQERPELLRAANRATLQGVQDSLVGGSR